MEAKRTGKRRSEWRIIRLLVFGLLLAAGISFFYFNIYRVTPAFSEKTYEYGDSVSRRLSDYLAGTDWSVGLGELDLSGVDEGQPGTYQAVVYHGSSQFTYTVTIQDTVPPEILWREDQVYVAVDALCTVEDVIKGLSDADPGVRAFFVQDGRTFESLRFENAGEYGLEILARDTAGNETRGWVRVIADTAPVFTGLRDFYVVPGSAPDYLEAVAAWDDLDGDLTECIRVDDSEVNLDEEGIYRLRYLAEDSNGLETVGNAKVMVASSEEIQRLIGGRRIDYRSDTIIGAPNIYDAGASAYENVKDTMEYMRPAFVQLYHSTGRGGYSSGSGYIMEITEDTVYICSNRHVVEKHEDWDIYFYDGTKAPGRVLGVSDGYDVGVAVVSREDIPEDLLLRLMTVHIDRTYWEGLDRQGVELALERVDRTGGLLHTSKGRLLKVKQDFEWNGHLEHTEVTVELVQGDSGSAVLDGYGNLICMAYAFSTNPTRYWCVPLDGILDSYKEITGRTPYVY